MASRPTRAVTKKLALKLSCEVFYLNRTLTLSTIQLKILEVPGLCGACLIWKSGDGNLVEWGLVNLKIIICKEPDGAV